MSPFEITSLIIFGIILIGVELYLIPGTTIVGIIGFLLTTAGVILTFSYYGVMWAIIAGISSLAFAILMFVISVKLKVWNIFALQQSVGKDDAETIQRSLLKIGDIGITTTTLRPSGEAEFDNHSYEVIAVDSMIQSKTNIEIVEIKRNKIFVKPIN